MLLKANNAINGNVISLFDSSPVCGNDFALFSCVFLLFWLWVCPSFVFLMFAFCNGALSFASLEPAEVWTTSFVVFDEAVVGFATFWVVDTTLVGVVLLDSTSPLAGFVAGVLSLPDSLDASFSFSTLGNCLLSSFWLSCFCDSFSTGDGVGLLGVAE